MEQIKVTKLNKDFQVRPKGFRRGYEALSVLEDIDFSVGGNEFVSILGPSGCGKSTLLRILAGLDDNYKGTIELEGTNRKNRRVPVCYMLQKDYLLPWRTLLQNVLLPLEIEKKDLKKAAADIQQLLRDFGLAGFENALPSTLSGGMRQRAALLRTYLMRGNIMLLDEPFGALDEITRMQMQDWLLSVWDKHRKTVLFVTHNIDEAVFLSDRVLVMGPRPGSIIKEIPICHDRPRSREMLVNHEFLSFKKEILEALRGKL